jgi:hypothetical protein
LKNIPMPKRIAKLDRDDKDRPVPFFVQRNHTEIDFRLIDPTKITRCFLSQLCWVCGEKLGVYKTFVLGPMCAVNRVNSEPPSHYDCARYSVQVCPFLSQPRMQRREGGLPDGLLVEEPAGIALYHNPGASALWVTKSYHPFADGRNGVLFKVGDPERVEWFALGQPASLEQVMEAINRGLPKLREYAKMDGPEAEKNLEKQYQELIPLLPKGELTDANTR